jgi:hypothetical protein
MPTIAIVLMTRIRDNLATDSHKEQTRNGWRFDLATITVPL